MLTTFQCMIRCLLQLTVGASVSNRGPLFVQSGRSGAFLRGLGWSGQGGGGWGAGCGAGRGGRAACVVVLRPPLSVHHGTVSVSEQLRSVLCLFEQHGGPSSHSARGGPRGAAELRQAIGHRRPFTVQTGRRRPPPLLRFSAIKVLCGGGV